MTPTRLEIEPPQPDAIQAWVVAAQYGREFGWAICVPTEQEAHTLAALMRLEDVATKDECEGALWEARTKAWQSAVNG